MKRFGGGRSDSLGLMATLWPAQAEVAIRTAIAALEQRSAGRTEVRYLSDALKAYEKKSFYTAKILAEAAATPRISPAARRPAEQRRSLADLKAKFRRLQRERRQLPEGIVTETATRAEPLARDAADDERTARARRAIALYALHAALAIVSRAPAATMAERLFEVNVAIDAFESGLYDDAVGIARAAADQDHRMPTPRAIPSAITVDQTIDRLRRLEGPA